MGDAVHVDRVNDAISAVKKAIEGLQDRVDDDHPSLLLWGFALAELLLQMNTADCLQEAEALLLTLVPALQKRFGPKHPFVKRATREFIFPTRGSGQSWDRGIRGGSRQHSNNFSRTSVGSQLAWGGGGLGWVGRSHRLATRSSPEATKATIPWQ